MFNKISIFFLTITPAIWKKNCNNYIVLQKLKCGLKEAPLEKSYIITHDLGLVVWCSGLSFSLQCCHPAAEWWSLDYSPPIQLSAADDSSTWGPATPMGDPDEVPGPGICLVQPRLWYFTDCQDETYTKLNDTVSWFTWVWKAGTLPTRHHLTLKARVPAQLSQADLRSHPQTQQWP